MSESQTNADPAYDLEAVSADSFRPATSRPLLAAALTILVVIGLAVAIPSFIISQKRAEVASEIERRLTILAAGRAEVIETWLAGIARTADRAVGSELFRLFATEVDLAGGDLTQLADPEETISTTGLPQSFDAPLVAQLPYMQQVLSDFAKNADFSGGYLVGRSGIAYVTSAGAPDLSADQQDRALAVLKSAQAGFGPLRETASGLAFDLYAPVFAPQDQTASGNAVGVMLLTLPVTSRLAEVLSPPPLAEPGERLALVEAVDGRMALVRPAASPALTPLSGEIFGADGTIHFAERPGLSGGGEVYSIGVSVTGPAWWLVQELDLAAAEAQLTGFVGATVSLAGLVVVAVAIAFGAFWWRLASGHNRALAEQFQRLARRIAAQKRLLDSINNTIADFIGLKAPDGTYRYVNPAFARALGRPVEQVVGLDDAALFGRGIADRLTLSDKRALASGSAVTTDEEVYLAGRQFNLQISKVPYRAEDGTQAGIVSVTRDVTELVEQQKKKERAIQQMVAALVRAVELRDEYLAGHSRRVAGFAVAVAQRLQASPDVIATVEIAANLSQIGKLSVPVEILTKPERLSGDESRAMQQHIDHASAILRDIDFELPVLQTIQQMHERLDGTGYPKGLKEGSVTLAARILGACDVFCARLEPRSYRPGITAEAALAILTDHPERYDATVVAALREVASSVTGEKLIAAIGVA